MYLKIRGQGQDVCNSDLVFSLGCTCFIITCHLIFCFPIICTDAV